MLKQYKLRHKLVALVVAMGSVPFGGALLNHWVSSDQIAAEALAMKTKNGQAHIERINQIVYASVMESRGIYMSPDWNVAKPYGDSLHRFLGELERTIAQLVADALPQERTLVQTVGRQAGEFVTLRKELVRVAREVSVPAGRAIGDNEANRSNRKEFNQSLKELSERYARHAELNLEGAGRARARVNAIVLLTGVLPIIGIFAGLLLVVRGFSRPIQGMTKAMTTLAAGDLEVEVPAQGQRDEMGEMARAVLVFRNTAVDKLRVERAAEDERVRSEAERVHAQEQAIAEERAMVSGSFGAALAGLAGKDLTVRISSKLPPAYAQLQRDFNDALQRLEEALHLVDAAASVITSSAHEVSNASNDLSRRTEQQAASLEESAAALDAISATGRKASDSADNAKNVVSAAQQDATQAGTVVRRTIDAMGDIEKSSEQVSKIIGVIDEIAFQTNLLALNAGVEAARAGEAGRGFAVVASEVRALAQRSADAAKEIKALISKSSSQVADGVRLVAQTGAALDQILRQVGDVEGAMTSIASATKQQSTGLSEVSTAINHMDQITQQNAAMVEETSAASETLAQEAQQLARLISAFKLAGREGRGGLTPAGGRSNLVAAPARRFAPVPATAVRA